MWKVLIGGPLPSEPLKRLDKDCIVELSPEDRAFSYEEICQKIEDIDGIICLLSQTIDRKIMTKAKKLRVISNYAVGYNNIDVKEASKRGILVTNTPGVLTETTADLTFALILAAARRIVEADKFCRQGKFKGWLPKLFWGTDVHHKVLGIIGMGRIGRAVARRGIGFGMKIIYYDPAVITRELDGIEATPVSLNELLSTADFVSIHIPLTEKTYKLIGEREFSLMKPSAFLINTSRGAVVDEKALATALEKGQIAGAGLDVYENEPEIEPRLIHLDNTVLLPHIGSASVETRTKMAELAVENLLAGLKGEMPPHPVNAGELKKFQA